MSFDDDVEKKIKLDFQRAAFSLIDTRGIREIIVDIYLIYY